MSSYFDITAISADKERLKKFGADNNIKTITITTEKSNAINKETLNQHNITKIVTSKLRYFSAFVISTSQFKPHYAVSTYQFSQ